MEQAQRKALLILLTASGVLLLVVVLARPTVRRNKWVPGHADTLVQ